jgi:hypothetical protein
MAGRIFEAGRTTAPDHMPERAKNRLHQAGVHTRLKHGLGHGAQEIAVVMLLQQFDQGHVGVGHRGLLRSVVEVRKLHHKPTSSMATPATPQARRESTPRPWTLPVCGEQAAGRVFFLGMVGSSPRVPRPCVPSVPRTASFRFPERITKPSKGLLRWSRARWRNAASDGSAETPLSASDWRDLRDRRLDLSRFGSGHGAHLGGLSFEGQGAFPAEG